MRVYVCFICLFVACTFHMCYGASRVDAKNRATEVMQKRLLIHNNYRRRSGVEVSVDELMELVGGESMTEIRETKSAQGSRIRRLRETYKGIPVYDTVVSVEVLEDGTLSGDASGTFVQGIEDDLPDGVDPVISPEEAYSRALKSEGDDDKKKEIKRHNVEHIIYLDNATTAYSSYLVDYMIVYGISTPKRMTLVIDAKVNGGRIIEKWSHLETFNCGERLYKAYGGNMKKGKLQYGNTPFCLEPRIEGDMCYLENKYCRVVDESITDNWSLNSTASFKCKNGYDDEINGAFSPAIDAFFFGTAVGKMFEEWFHSTPLIGDIILKVHHGDAYENAFWDGGECYFGDGADKFFPLTTMDIVGHEIGHGVSEYGSGLEYRDEAGGLNEAFSDILGEATENFILGQPDMKVGLDAMKDGFLRDFRDPEVDGSSVGHVNDFYSSMDPHYSSGVYRRVYYVITQQKGVKVRPATHVFIHANRMYWRERSTFQDAGCGVIKAAYDLGQNPTPYLRALDDVGVIPCDVSRHIRQLRENNPISGMTVNADVSPLFGYEAPTDSVNIKASSSQGNVKITVRVGTWENDEEARERLDIYREGVNSLSIDGVEGRVLFTELSVDGDYELNDVSVVAQTESSKRDFLRGFIEFI